MMPNFNLNHRRRMTFSEMSKTSRDPVVSYINSNAVLGKSTSVFKELNPKIDVNQTRFQLNLARLAGHNPIVDVGITPMTTINTQIEDISDYAAGQRIAGRRIPTEMSLIEIFHLSSPRGGHRPCEICPKEAEFCCNNCQVTFYCSVSHHRKDCIHELVCARLKILRNPTIHTTNDIDRRRVIGQKSYLMVKLLDDLVRQAYGFIFQSMFEEAIVTLGQSVSFLPKLYDRKHCVRQLIVIYTANCEACIGHGNHIEAQSMLKKAIAALYNAEELFDIEDLNFSRAHVNKAQGHLLFANGNVKEAVFFFSEYVYHITKEVGPYHVKTGTGYFYLARCFLRMGQYLNGYKLLEFCVDLWTAFLFDIFRNRTAILTLHGRIQKGDKNDRIPFITEMEIRQGLKEVWEWLADKTHPKVICKLVLADGIMLYLYKQNRDALEHARRCSTTLRTFEADKELMFMCKYFRRYAVG